MILYNREARVCGSHSLRLTFIDGATRHNACSAVVGRLGGSGRRAFFLDRRPIVATNWNG